MSIKDLIEDPRDFEPALSNLTLYRVSMTDNFGNVHYRNYQAISRRVASSMATIYHPRWHVMNVEPVQEKRSA